MNHEKKKLLKPDQRVSSLSAIELERLRGNGKRGIILDLDNTITRWNENALSAEAHDFIRKALSLQFGICLLSNAKEARTTQVAANYDLPFISFACKPAAFSFRKALRLLQLTPEEVIVVGDQIFTDVLGGNWAGCLTILVPPLTKKEFLWTRFMRLLEKIVE